MSTAQLYRGLSQYHSLKIPKEAMHGKGLKESDLKAILCKNIKYEAKIPVTYVTFKDS